MVPYAANLLHSAQLSYLYVRGARGLAYAYLMRWPSPPPAGHGCTPRTWLIAICYDGVGGLYAEKLRGVAR